MEEAYRLLITGVGSVVGAQRAIFILALRLSVGCFPKWSLWGSLYALRNHSRYPRRARYIQAGRGVEQRGFGETVLLGALPPRQASLRMNVQQNVRTQVHMLCLKKYARMVCPSKGSTRHSEDARNGKKLDSEGAEKGEGKGTGGEKCIPFAVVAVIHRESSTG